MLCGQCGAATTTKDGLRRCVMNAEHDHARLFTLRIQDSKRLGYVEIGKSGRYRGPDGEVYARCVLGKPSMCLIGLTGERLFLSVVSQGSKA